MRKNFCINGLIHSITAVLLLSEDLLKDSKSDTYFLLTSRLNQDPIENIFAQIRAKGGNRKNPSVHEFKYTVARLMSLKMLNIVSFTQNCENDDDLMFDWVQNDLCSIELNNGNGFESSSSQAESEYVGNFIRDLEILPNCNDHTSNDSLVIEENAKRYYIGYVISKIIFKKFDCSSCALTMAKGDSEIILPTEHFICNKDFKESSSQSNPLYLKSPSDYFFSICQLHFSIYQEFYNNCLHITNIKENIIKACINKTNEVYPEWFSESSPCFVHRKIFVDFLILVLLRKN